MPRPGCACAGAGMTSAIELKRSAAREPAGVPMPSNTNAAAAAAIDFSPAPAIKQCPNKLPRSGHHSGYMQLSLHRDPEASFMTTPPHPLVLRGREALTRGDLGTAEAAAE